MSRRICREDERARIPIEGKFGQGKNGYRLNQIRAKLASSSQTWVRSIFLVMNLIALIRCLLPEIWIRLFGALKRIVSVGEIFAYATSALRMRRNGLVRQVEMPAF